MNILFLTGNKHKLEVAQHALSDFPDIHIDNKKIDCPEIQAATVQEVAEFSAKWAAEELQQPVVKTDSGLHIQGLNGFPGAYMSDINDWLSAEDILSMMQNKPDKKAHFVDVVSYCEPNGEAVSFISETHGTIALESAGEGDWPIDSVFIPDGFDKTLNQMSREERLKVWNVSRWHELAKYLMNKIS